RGSPSPHPATHRRSPADCRSAPSETRRSGETSRPRRAPCSSALRFLLAACRAAGEPAASGFSVNGQPARGELCLHSSTRTCQPGDAAAVLALLPLEPLDPLGKFLQRNLELGRLPVAHIIEVEHLAHFLEREADRLAGENIGESRAIPARIEPLLA